MTKYLTISIILLLVSITGCYLPLGGKVIDAESGQPIEGAVVVAQWHESHGLPGMVYHTLYKIAEASTDNNGKFLLPGAYSPFANIPDLLIYKRGYVVWNRDLVLIFKKKQDGTIESTFMGKRADYDSWEHGYLYKLEPFKEGYSHDKNSRLMCCFDSSTKETPMFKEAETYENKAAEPERELIRHQFYEK